MSVEESYRLNIDLSFDLISRPWVGLEPMLTPGSEALAVSKASRDEADRLLPTLIIKPLQQLERGRNLDAVAQREARFLSLKATSMRERCIDLMLAIDTLVQAGESSFATSHCQLHANLKQLVSCCDECLDALTAYGWNQEIVERYTRPGLLPWLTMVDGKPQVRLAGGPIEKYFVLKPNDVQ